MGCLWEHESSCEDECVSSNIEFSVYLAQLVLRLQQGSDFFGRFFIYAAQYGGGNSIGTGQMRDHQCGCKH